MKPLAAEEQRIGTVALAPDEVPKPRPRGHPGGSPSLRIGGWCIDRATNEIARGGETVHLEPKVMDVLVALAAEPGAVLSREQLLAAAWPGMVVGDEALTQSIIKLRRALGDNPRSPAFIETIPKRGYRLIADVAQGDAAAARADPGSVAAGTLGSVAAGTRAAPVHRPRGSIAAAVAVVLVVAAVAAALYGAAPGTAPSSPSPPPASGPRAGDEDASGLPTVTVLPFDTVGAGSEQAYLAQGIGSDLMTDLSRLAEVRVINTRTEASAPGATPPARYVIAGSVQKDGGTLRINVRLTDASSGVQLWSHRYERPFGDLLAIQSEISRAVVERLPATLSDAERRRLAKRYTQSTEAYEDFLRARALFLVRRPDANERARALYRKALDIDPQFARAYAGLAMTYAMDYRYQHAGESADTLDRALQLAQTAREIDPDIPEVYWAIGFVQTQGRHHDQAIAALKKAIELNPSYADAYALMGGIYTYLGEPAQSIPLLRTALRLNPEGGYLYFLLLGRAYLFEDDLDQALLNLREATQRNPEDLEAHIYLAAALVAAGDRRAAESEADEVRVRDAQFSMRRWLGTYPLTSPREVRRLLDLTSAVQL
jgi:DNA-binding winged helix-turn-helix (wHTH) protein/TolB-like protein/Tfp pilus assembly protein PilF